MDTENETTALAPVTAMVTEIPDETHTWTTGTVLSILYIIFGCIGLVGNSFVILVIFTYTAMRKSFTNLLIINQSLVDALSSAVLVLSIVFNDPGKPLFGLDGEVLCRLWYSKTILWGSMMVSTLNLVAITLERHMAIVYPIKYKSHATRRRVVVTCLIVWVLGISFQMAINLPTCGLDDRGICHFSYFWPSVIFQRAIGAFTIIVKFVIPLTVMLSKWPPY